MPDNLNPIFVLNTRLLYETFRYWWKEMIFAYILLSVFVLWFASPVGFPRFLLIPFYFCLLAGGIGCFTTSFARMSQLYVDDDLIHYTAMSDKEVLWGYFQVAFFRSGVLYGIGLLMFAWTTPFQSIGETLNALLNILFLYAVSCTFGLISASFHAGVRKHNERTILPILQIFLFFVFFILGPYGVTFLHIASLVPNSDVIKWLISAYTTIPLMAVSAYHLTMSNVTRKQGFILRMTLNLYAYFFIFIGLWLIFIVTMVCLTNPL